MDLTAKKQAFASQMAALADEMLSVAEKIDDLTAAYSVNGFHAGGAHAFVDGDFAVNNTQLSAAIVADVMFAVGTLQNTLTAGVRNSLREGIMGGLP